MKIEFNAARAWWLAQRIHNPSQKGKNKIKHKAKRKRVQRRVALYGVQQIVCPTPADAT